DNRALRIGGVFLTMVEKNNVHRDLEEQLRGLFGGLVFETKIPRSMTRRCPVSRLIVPKTTRRALAPEIGTSSGRPRRPQAARSGGNSSRSVERDLGLALIASGRETRPATQAMITVGPLSRGTRRVAPRVSTTKWE
ncbi:MAG TPA: hypothetical protein VKP69_19310, partial [Isosphaeraceae bacterium]|nr:hypothetical protein [Isosphaeraceae bacterium]